MDTEGQRHIRIQRQWTVKQTGTYRGVHPPWDHDAFPPLFQISPLFHKNVWTFWKIFTILPFPEKFLDFLTFICQNFWWPFFVFLVIDHKFRISPLFSLLQYISPPPVSRKLFFPPYFYKFPPLFYANSPAFYILYVYFPPTLTMMHLCITQCTYWTPLGT